MHIAERLTPSIMHQGFEEYESLELELGHRAAKAIVAEEIGGMLVRQALAEEAQASQVAA